MTEDATAPEWTEPVPRGGPRTVDCVEPARPAPRDAPGDDESPREEYVYAIGRVEPRFPSLSVEKEFRQAAARLDSDGLTDHQVMRAVLAERTNRYLARLICWVFTVQGLETYLLIPRDPADLELLTDTIRADPGPADMDVVVGVRGPDAPPQMCNGLMLPLVVFDVLYSFDRPALIDALPRPADLADDEAARFTATAGEVLDRFVQVIDNAGAMNEHRALNYLAVRYDAVYSRTVEAHRAGQALSGVEVRVSRLSGTRDIRDVIFSYVDRRTDVVEKYFVRVDVTEEFPYLLSKLSPFYEH